MLYRYKIVGTHERRHKPIGRPVVHHPGRPHLLHKTIVHDTHLIRNRKCFLLIVRDIHRGDAKGLLQRTDVATQINAQFGVQVRERLVHQQYFGPDHQSPGQAHPLLLPATELVGHAGREVVELNRGRDLAKSIANFERSLALKRKLEGDHSPDFESTQGNFGRALRAAGERERALEVLRSNLELARDLYGDASELVAVGHNEVGYTYHDMGRFAEAASEYRESMAIRQKLGSDKGASFAIPLNNLASAYEDMGDFAAAEPMFRRSLELRLSGQDADSPMIANGEYNLARLLVKRGQLTEAGERIAKALAIYRKRFGDDHRNVIKAELLEAARLLDDGQFDKAAELSAKINASPTKLGDSDIARRDALTARIATSHGDTQRALLASASAWDAIHRGWGDHHPLTLEYGLAYARQLRSNGDEEKAKAILRSIKDLAPAFSEESPLRIELARSLREMDS